MKSKKSHKSRPTCNRYKAERRWEKNRDSKMARRRRKFNHSRNDKVQTLVSQLLGRKINPNKWTLTSLRRRVSR